MKIGARLAERWKRWSVALAFGLIVAPLGVTAAGAQATAPYEVWVVDQANADAGGNKLYIFQGAQLSGNAAVGAPAVVDLQAGATGVGDGPGVRPHLLLFNAGHTHGVLANVVSGHVQFIRASDRRVTGSVDVGEQAHGAVPSADNQIALVANQNGKKLARIRTDYGRESYVHEAAADLNLGALEDAEHPDNAPICPVMFVDGTRKAYVTVRGGGLYVVDTQATPMRVIKEFGRSQIAPAGCGGVVVGNKVYINSGTANSSDLYVFDARTDALLKHLSLTDTGTDAHGMLLTGGGRYLWVANRANGDNIVVIDTVRDEVVGIIPNVGSAPDLIDAAPGALAQSRCEPATTSMCLTPGGTRAFISARPPNPLTGGPAAAGEQTGISVVSIAEGGRTGSQLFFVPVGDTNADIHALAVRLTAATSAARLPATGAGEALGAGNGLWGAVWGGAALLSAVAAIGVRRWIGLRQRG